MQPLSFHNFEIISYGEQLTQISGGYKFFCPKVLIEFKEKPYEYYYHGWQSWSLAAWLPANFQLPVQKPALLHPMQIDPLYAKHPAPNGSWLGAVRFHDGNILLLGSLGLDAHVALHGKELHGWHEAGSVEWFIGYGEEHSIFACYASLLGERLGNGPRKPTPGVWCSWYSLYTAINESLLYKTFDLLGNLPFDVLQVDDGWQISIGDWDANPKFPSGMKALADKIRANGRTAGLWLAPLIAVKSSRLFRKHPDWFIKTPEGNFASAGYNWGEQLYALDTTHPEALDWLAGLMNQVRAWGFDYIKLDFLYAGALPGVRHAEIPREVAYRQGLKTMRDAMGIDAYFLSCGAPIIPSIGLCDAIRVGPDVAGEWESHRDAVQLYNPTTPGTRNAIRTSLNRLWLQPLISTDPDVAYFRSQKIKMNTEQKQMLQDLAQISNFKATSDLPQWLGTEERKKLHSFLEAAPRVKRIGAYSFIIDKREVDFSPEIALPNLPSGLDKILSPILGWLGNQTWILNILNKQSQRELKKIVMALHNHPL